MLLRKQTSLLDSISSFGVSVVTHCQPCFQTGGRVVEIEKLGCCRVLVPERLAKCLLGTVV